jgi:hypothetical protein
VVDTVSRDVEKGRHGEETGDEGRDELPRQVSEPGNAHGVLSAQPAKC